MHIYKNIFFPPKGLNTVEKYPLDAVYSRTEIQDFISKGTKASMNEIADN